ncbi:MAG: ECF transporter S component [Oscillospiraceae bacterium]|nr:ECF transporter S component [Oscillospiraceae bacterium]
MTNTIKFETKNLTIAGVCLALCMALPLLTGQLQEFGMALAPMHIPVLLCGLLAGGKNAALIGFIAPLLRFMLFGMPPMPMGVAMAFELAVYGAAAGVLYCLLSKNATPKGKAVCLYISLITAMFAGRVVWGLVMWQILEMFTWDAFVAGAFINAVPGIVLHIIIIPPIVIAVERLSQRSERA